MRQLDDEMPGRVGAFYVPRDSSERGDGAYVPPHMKGGGSGPSVSVGSSERRGRAYVPPGRRGGGSRPSISVGTSERQTSIESQVARNEQPSSLGALLQKRLGDTLSGHMPGSDGQYRGSSERTQWNQIPIPRSTKENLNGGSTQTQESYAQSERLRNVSLEFSISDKSNGQAHQDKRSLRNIRDVQNSEPVPGQRLSTANTERRPYNPVYTPRCGNFCSSDIPRFLRFLSKSRQKPQVIYENRDKLKIVIQNILQSGHTSEHLNALIELFTDPSVKHDTSDHRSDNFSIFVSEGKFVLQGSIIMLALLDMIPEQFPDFISAIVSTDRGLLKIMNMTVETLKQLGDRVGKHASEQIQKMASIIHKEQSKHERQKGLQTVEPPNRDFFEAPVVTFTNDWSSPHNSWEEYRDMLCFLTSEDYVRSFRKAVHALQEHNLDTRDLHIYDHVRITEGEDHTEADMFLKFDPRMEYERSLTTGKRASADIDWENSNRLERRNLVILSKCRECRHIDALLMICKYEPKSLAKGIIPVRFIRGEVSCNEEYYMFEPLSNWSGHCATLKGLMYMHEMEFPSELLPVFVKGSFKHIKGESGMPVNLETLIHPDKQDHIFEWMRKRYISASQLQFQTIGRDEWPFDHLSPKQQDSWLRVDHEQYQAVRHATRHVITLVNGAPGTGKTHLAREYVRLLLSLKRKAGHYLSDDYESESSSSDEDYSGRLSDPPIVVCTYTNHSLDAFLEGIIDILVENGMRFVRCGGKLRTENRIIMGHRLSHSNYSSRYSRCLHKEVVDSHNAVQKAQEIGVVIAEVQKLIISKSDERGCDSLSLANVFAAGFKRLVEADLIREENITLLKSRFRIFDQTEEEQYRQFWRRKKAAFRLPNDEDYFVFWLLGHSYYEAQKARLRADYNNIVRSELGFVPAANRFSILGNSEEEDDIERSDSDDDVSEGASDQLTISRTDVESKLQTGREEAGEIDLSREALGIRINTAFAACLKQQETRMLQFCKFLGKIEKWAEIITRNMRELSHKLESHKEAIEQDDLGRYFRTMDVIAITSTMASLYRNALSQSGCEYFIIEEAGELTESMMAGIMPSSVKHLMLIGDYNQLRPKVEFELARPPFNHDVSGFERFVRLAQQQEEPVLFTLSVQRRMHPDISCLVREAFYTNREPKEELNDSDPVPSYGIAYGVSKRVQFVLHDYLESPSAGRSHRNDEEAKMAASLVVFFMERGYSPNDITVVVLYKGQKHAVYEQLTALSQRVDIASSEWDSFKGVKPSDFRVKVLDDFQGEENKVIIVSLTRSDSAGFVKNRNRALVTLSRAREYMIVLGNRHIFGTESQTLWKDISGAASKMGYVSPGIEVDTCPVHTTMKGSKNVLNNAEDILKFRFSFCEHKCNFLLPCGHRCHLPCHCRTLPPGLNEHDDYHCPELCGIKCQRGHPCRNICSKCPWKESDHHDDQCQVMIPFEFPCGHTCDVRCGDLTAGTAICSKPCEEILPCGHRCPGTCGQCRSKGQHSPCMEPCPFVLECGHRCSKPCCHNQGIGEAAHSDSHQHELHNDHAISDDSDSEREANREMIMKHICQTMLTEECPRCHNQVTFQCGSEPECKTPCNEILPCGHECKGRCSECFRSGHRPCNEHCCFEFPCGHKCEHQCTPEHQHLLCEHQACAHFRSSNPLQCLKYPCRQCKMQFDSGPSCVKRCRCQCARKCKKCGQRCQALANEQCAIFCKHHLGEENKPDSGLVFVFHDKHWMPLEEAERAVMTQFREMILGESDIPVPVTALKCPCSPDCHIHITESVLFSFQILETWSTLQKIEQQSKDVIAQNPEIAFGHKVGWFICPCGELIPHSYNDESSLLITCPHCGNVRGTQFE